MQEEIKIDSSASNASPFHDDIDFRDGLTQKSYSVAHKTES